MENYKCSVCWTELNTGFKCPNGCDPYYQKKKIIHSCPVCCGQGKVQRPPWVGGDQETWSSAGTELYECRACKGTGIIWEIL